MSKYKDIPGFIEGRWPYTYAYDLLRQLIPMHGDNSRSDQSQFTNEICKNSGVDHREFCEALAEVYLKYKFECDKAELDRKNSVDQIMLAMGLPK